MQQLIAILKGVVAWYRASIWSLQDTVSSLESQLQSLKDNDYRVVVQGYRDEPSAIY